ncbi:Flp1 family type IVb pilin [Numidum massiliense]|uniref:Flp1 family type IVb pilin n=1 Tax=Numidum massiliense TaxID=1522315 RepID=UPI000938F4A5|nr:Flp1 family type IVb pilin [Numidum massiliense]
MWQWLKRFWKDEEGLQTLEIMLIIAVIVVIALLFRSKIKEWIDHLIGVGDKNIKQFN